MILALCTLAVSYLWVFAQLAGLWYILSRTKQRPINNTIQCGFILPLKEFIVLAFILDEDKMMNDKFIPDIVIGRLPMYLRSLQRMAQENRHTTSSQELGERLGISAAQIRKDLSQFGEFGKQGTGYNITFLIEQIRSILHVDRVWDIAVVGAGDIGSAVAGYQGFIDRGYKVGMIFDNDPEKIGKNLGSFIIKPITEMVGAIQNANIKVAMIAVPAAHAQEVADLLVKAGVKAILNYAPISINVPSDIRVQYIDPVTHLQRMTYYL
jgi:redox-sensing transcriptional repressor